MYISKFQISNYKSYLDSNEVEFKRGFNVITGKNNAGKTALLEALNLQFDANPHRTIETVKYPGDSPSDPSVARVTFVVEQKELLRIIGDQRRFLPPPKQRFRWDSGSFDGSPQSAFDFVTWLVRQNEFRITVRLLKPVGGGATWEGDEQIFGLYPTTTKERNNIALPFLTLQVNSQGQPLPPTTLNADGSNDVSIFLAQRLTTQIYRFTAERFNIGESVFGHNAVLSSNAQNLPEVLNALQANTTKFQQFNDLVREILPQIKHISVRPQVGNRVQIITWPHDPKSMREDVAIPLSQCGSGVGQVLAILYVVMTSVHPQTIIIDEPQNFLHPGAVRKLIEVLKRYPQHQYIFATHSPTVIAATDPQTLIMTQIEDCRSSLLALNISDNKDLQYSLSDIGASLSDVFGADQILWVEGATEQGCFPLIVRDILKRPLLGTAIVSIRETGDLEGRDAKRVFQLYNRLSNAAVLLPPAVGFILDHECRSDAQKDELRKLSQGRAEFLARRMYENYLLNPRGIAEVANEIPNFLPDRPVSERDVESLLQAKRQLLDFYCRGTAAVPADWMKRINASRLLSEIFSELSESRVAFEKTKHSVSLTKWLIQNDPESLREVADLIGRMLPT
jgi:energy-coupling factor transporter ATP-binding protein EcfA2